MTESTSTSIMAPSGARRLTLGWDSNWKTSNPEIAFAGDAQSRSRMSLSDHISNYGRIPTGFTYSLVSDSLRVANLTGRGGAKFPFYKKLAAVYQADRKKGCYIVANGAESEPLSIKDSTLLKTNPHLVIDVLVMVAEVLSAKGVYIYVKDKEAHSAVNAAIRERKERGFNEAKISIVDAPATYVAGQETSVIRRIEKGPALPKFSIDRVAVSGVKGQPTLLSNVETFAHLGLILRFGADWYRSGRSGFDSGSRLVTVSGAVGRPGLYEVSSGVSVGEILREAKAQSVRAVLVGGYFGGWLNVRDESELKLTYDDVTLAEKKLSIGAGILGVLSKETCPVVEAASIVDYLTEQSAGQCGPCVYGLPEISTAFARIALSSNVDRGISELKAVIPLVERRGGCQHPDGVIAHVRSTVAAFGDEIKLHKAGKCSVASSSHQSMLLPKKSQGNLAAASGR